MAEFSFSLGGFFSDSRPKGHRQRRSSLPYAPTKKESYEVRQHKGHMSADVSRMESMYGNFFERFHSIDLSSSKAASPSELPRPLSGDTCSAILKPHARSMSLPGPSLTEALAHERMDAELLGRHAPLDAAAAEERKEEKEQEAFETPVFVWARGKSPWEMVTEDVLARYKNPSRMVRWLLYFNGDDHRIDLLHNRFTGHKVILINGLKVFSGNTRHMERKVDSGGGSVRREAQVVWTCELEAAAIPETGDMSQQVPYILLIRILDQSKKRNASIPRTVKRFAYDMLINGKPWLTAKHQFLSSPYGSFVQKHFDANRAHVAELRALASGRLVRDLSWFKEEVRSTVEGKKKLWQEQATWHFSFYGHVHVISFLHNAEGLRRVECDGSVSLETSRPERFVPFRHALSLGAGQAHRATVIAKPNKEGVLGESRYLYSLQIDGVEFDDAGTSVTT